ncbi:MAG: clan AA aspartic protease [Deltaproteobacteria bacterium]|nr:clan AA aspartic protease [Deltaproteobacteria bacterium]
MGEVRASVVLENAADRELARRGALAPSEVRQVTAILLVDTGAVLVLLPQDLVEALGLEPPGRAIVAPAHEQRVELGRAGPLRLTVAGRTTTADCLVGPPGCEPLLGQVVLESLDLVVDPLREQVTPRPESPFLPTLKLK